MRALADSIRAHSHRATRNLHRDGRYYHFGFSVSPGHIDIRTPFVYSGPRIRTRVRDVSVVLICFVEVLSKRNDTAPVVINACRAKDVCIIYAPAVSITKNKEIIISCVYCFFRLLSWRLLFTQLLKTVSLAT